MNQDGKVFEDNLSRLLQSACEPVQPAPVLEQRFLQAVTAQRRPWWRRWPALLIPPVTRPLLRLAPVAVGLGLMLLLLLLLATLTFGPVGPTARLVASSGSVTVAGRTGERTLGPGEDTTLAPGEQVSAASEARLSCFPDQEIDLRPGTVVVVEQLASDPSGRTAVRLLVRHGEAVARLRDLPIVDSRFEVCSPSVTASVHGTIFRLHAIDDERTVVACDQGQVGVRLGDQEVIVQAGQVVEAQVGQPLVVRPRYSPRHSPLAGSLIARCNPMENAGCQSLLWRSPVSPSRSCPPSGRSSRPLPNSTLPLSPNLVP